MKSIIFINEAVRQFNKLKIGYLRTVRLLEGSGSGENWTELSVGIEYLDTKEEKYKGIAFRVQQVENGKLITGIQYVYNV